MRAAASAAASSRLLLGCACLLARAEPEAEAKSRPAAFCQSTHKLPRAVALIQLWGRRGVSEGPGAGENGLTPFEVDYLNDADNPLDDNRTDFDCAAGLARWGGWSVEKKAFCCSPGPGGLACGGGGGAPAKGDNATSSTTGTGLGTTKNTTTGAVSTTAGSTSTGAISTTAGSTSTGAVSTTAESTTTGTVTTTAGSTTTGTVTTTAGSTTTGTVSTTAGNTTTGTVSTTAGSTTAGESGESAKKTDPHTVIGCGTRRDPRASEVMYTTSPEGTPCIFGVDDRDEGSHCIMDNGKYGSFGWCWTATAMDSWGSCNESCPLFGPAKVLGAKIDALKSELEDVLNSNASAVANSSALANGSSTGVPSTTLLPNTSVTLPATTTSTHNGPVGTSLAAGSGGDKPARTTTSTHKAP